MNQRISLIHHMAETRPKASVFTFKKRNAHRDSSTEEIKMGMAPTPSPQHSPTQLSPNNSINLDSNRRILSPDISNIQLVDIPFSSAHKSDRSQGTKRKSRNKVMPLVGEECLNSGDLTGGLSDIIEENTKICSPEYKSVSVISQKSLMGSFANQPSTDNNNNNENNNMNNNNNENSKEENTKKDLKYHLNLKNLKAPRRGTVFGFSPPTVGIIADTATIIEETDEEKSKRLRLKWKFAIKQIIMRRRIASVFNHVKEEVQLMGTSKFREQQTEVESPQHKRARYCLILPESKFKFSWNGIMIILLLFSGIYIPLRVAFYDEVPLTLIVIEYIIDVLFVSDIFINFISAYHDGDHIIVTNHCKIAKNYITGWFFIDIIACFPFQLLDTNSENSGQYNKLLRLLRLGRMYRLLRMLVFLRMSRFFRENKVYEKLLISFKMNAGIKRLITALFAICFLFHIFGCMWFFLAKMNDFNPDTWVVRYGFRDKEVGEQYLVSVYWVLTLCTVGYGDINPLTISERLASMIFMLFGVAVYTYTIGSLTTFLSQSDSRNRRLKGKLLALDDYALSIGMPHELYYRIKRIIKGNHQMDFYSSIDQENLLEELPAAMRAEVITLTHRKTLEKIKFFKGKNPNFLLEILPVLRRISMCKGEVLFSEGDWADEMYFLLKGRVQLISTDGYIFMTYVEGSYMGDAELLTEPEFRNCSLITAENCELLVLKRGDLTNILNDYPDIKDEMLRINKMRVDRNVKSLEIAVKDDQKLEDYDLLIGKGRNNMFNKSYFGHKQTLGKIPSLSFHSGQSMSSKSQKPGFPKSDSKFETHLNVNNAGDSFKGRISRTNTYLDAQFKNERTSHLYSLQRKLTNKLLREKTLSRHSPPIDIQRRSFETPKEMKVTSEVVIASMSSTPKAERVGRISEKAPIISENLLPDIKATNKNVLNITIPLVEEMKQCETPLFPLAKPLIAKSTIMDSTVGDLSEDRKKDTMRKQSITDRDCRDCPLTSGRQTSVISASSPDSVLAPPNPKEAEKILIVDKEQVSDQVRDQRITAFFSTYEARSSKEKIKTGNETRRNSGESFSVSAAEDLLSDGNQLETKDILSDGLKTFETKEILSDELKTFRDRDDVVKININDYDNPRLGQERLYKTHRKRTSVELPVLSLNANARNIIMKNQRVQTEDMIVTEVEERLDKFEIQIGEILINVEDCSDNIRLIMDDNEEMWQKLLIGMNKKTQMEQVKKKTNYKFSERPVRKSKFNMKDLLEFENNIDAKHS